MTYTIKERKPKEIEIDGQLWEGATADNSGVLSYWPSQNRGPTIPHITIGDSYPGHGNFHFWHSNLRYNVNVSAKQTIRAFHIRVEEDNAEFSVVIPKPVMDFAKEAMVKLYKIVEEKARALIEPEIRLMAQGRTREANQRLFGGMIKSSRGGKGPTTS